jgi:protein MpaA
MRRLPALLAAALGVALAAPAPAAVEQAVPGPRIERLGASVQGRPINLVRVGDPAAPRKVLVVGSIHGDEPAGRGIVDLLRAGSAAPPGAELLLVRNLNPDGLQRRTRQNAHGVDLNRNYPYQWAELDGNYESGPAPKSEPETRAMIRFLKDVRPHRILSFHQPLYGVDLDTKNRRFARKVARTLQLPKKTFTCGGVCHGTMTSWYNHKFSGAALTVEYGADPSSRMMRVVAPSRVLKIFGALRARFD